MYSAVFLSLPRMEPIAKNLVMYL